MSFVPHPPASVVPAAPNEPYLYDLQDDGHAPQLEDVSPCPQEGPPAPDAHHQSLWPSIFTRPSVQDEYVYGGAEYLRWWIKDGPSNTPLVTTGDSAVDAIPGAIGQSTTRVLFGGDDFDFDDLSGVRATFGFWKDVDRRFGFEVTGFVLEERSIQFNSRSTAAGNPPVFLPFNSVLAGTEGAFVISDPNLNFQGNLSAVVDTQLWGIETNSLYNVWRRDHHAFDLLAGFRYADLGEKLVITGDLFDPTFDARMSMLDRFDTRSQFYGGQVGFHAGWRVNRLSVDVLGKVALGVSRSRVSIDGATTLTGGMGPQGTFVGAVFTQPSNIGLQRSTDFAVIPQGQIKFGYDILSHVTLFAGYDFMYWNRVVRPGDQIDRNVNTSQALGGALVGPASPQPLFVTSDFWAHGLSGGLFIKF